MRFVIDLDSLELIESATDRRRVTQVEGKRGDDSPFEVVFVRSGIAEELAASTVLTFGAKEEGKYDAAAVVLENGFALSGSGTTAKYSANPSFNTAALNELFLIDADDTNDPTYVDLMAEFTWQIGAGAPTSTKTFRFRVHNDVVRDDEFSPTPDYSPIGNTAPVNEVAAVAATETLTLSANALAGEMVTVGGKTYKFVASVALDDVENNIEIGATASETLDTLIYAINGGTGSVIGTGTTANEDVTAVAGVGNTMDVTAIVPGAAGNLIALDSSLMTYGDWGGSNLSGGSDLVPATAAPPYIRTAGGFLYIQEAGVWKKTALSAL